MGLEVTFRHFALFAVVVSWSVMATPSRATDTQADNSSMRSAMSFLDRFDTFDRKMWVVSDGWRNGNHQNCLWSKKQVAVADGILRVKLEPRQSADVGYICGELQSNERFGYGTYEVRMRSADGPGLVSAFFTYIGPTQKQPWDEIDFEFLGKDSRSVQLNYYVNSVGKHEKIVPFAFDSSQEFHDYAFVWKSDGIRWYVDKKLVHEIKDAKSLPTHAGKVFISLWGGTAETRDWLGPFVYEGQPKTIEVDRVSFTAQGDKCQFPESLACSPAP